MIVDCAHYKDGHRRDAGLVSLEEAAARRDEGGFVWLGLSSSATSPSCSRRPL